MSVLTARTPASRPQDWLIRQLPAGMLSEDFFIRFVSLFQAEADTLLEHADAIENLADVQVAPATMVRYMSQWIGTPGIDAALPDAELRALVRATARAVRVRGTLTGLRIMVEAFTGAEATIEESGGVFRLGRAPLDQGWVRIKVPNAGNLRPTSLIDLVRDEIPAHLHVELWIADERVWATPGGENAGGVDLDGGTDAPVGQSAVPQRVSIRDGAAQQPLALGPSVRTEDES